MNTILNFESDYIEGAHPEILNALAKTNFEQVSGYGHDKFCESAREKIKAACGLSDSEAKVHFISGGTQTNQIVIDSILRQFEGVVSAESGHISVHEAGAIEFTGHKVLPLRSDKGKINADGLDSFVSGFYADGNAEHMVFPGMVYISFPTEYGTLYTKNELSAIYNVCKKHKMPLFIDGARLGYGLASEECDLNLHDIAERCDVFYIGGTKIGAFCGEAVVFTKNNEPLHFENLIKKHGGLLAKGRLLGIQFDTLFTDNLYFKISRNAIDCANLLKEILREKGYKFLFESPTNQQFVILENRKMTELSEKVRFSFWEKHDENHTVVRFATSWATKKENVELLAEFL